MSVAAHVPPAGSGGWSTRQDAAGALARLEPDGHAGGHARRAAPGSAGQAGSRAAAVAVLGLGLEGLPGAPTHEDVDDRVLALASAAVREEEVAGLLSLVEEQSARLAAALGGC